MGRATRDVRGATLFIILAQGYWSIIFLLYVGVVAIRNDGHVQLHWNHYGEAWAEVILLGLIAALYPVALYKALRGTLAPRK